MSTMWKVLVGLALSLPLGAFVAGSLVGASADEPAPRETIVIQDAPTRPGDDASRSPDRRNDDARPDDHPSASVDDSGHDDRDDDPTFGDDDVEVVRPEPDTVGDDNSGPGGGGDDRDATDRTKGDGND